MDALRQHLISLLSGKGAHASFDDAIGDLPREHRGKRPKGGDHSPWELVEHIRIAQWDILDYVRNPNYEEMKWPGDYWPKSPAPANDAEWKKSIDAFHRDLNDVEELVRDAKNDLLAPMKHTGGKHTILREVLLVADHNAYHVGQLVMAKKLLAAQ